MAEDNNFSKWATLVTGTIAYPIICLMGIVSNCLCIIVFTRKKMRNSTNVYLTMLAVSDTIKNLNDFLYFPTILINLSKPRQGNILYAMYYPYGFFISQFAASVSAWITVSVALERLLMVVYPGCARGLLTMNKARAETFIVYLVLGALNVPCALRYYTVCRPNANSNITTLCSNLTVYDLDTSAMWQNINFRKTYTLFQSCLRSIVPVLILILLNVRIIISLHQTRANKRLKARNRVTLMLIIVVCCFIGLAAPDAIMSLMGWGYHDAESNLRKGIREITDMMLALNSATNFFLYISFNSVFRENLLLLCCSANSPCSAALCGGPPRRSGGLEEGNNNKDTTANTVGKKSAIEQQHHQPEFATVNRECDEDLPLIVVGTTTPTNGLAAGTKSSAPLLLTHETSGLLVTDL